MLDSLTAVRDGRVATWRGWHLYTDTVNLLCLPNRTTTHRLSHLHRGNVVAVAPAITQLHGEGLSHNNAITHSFHPHSQPHGAPLPLMLCIAYPLCSAPPLFFFIFLQRLPSPTISISTRYGSNSSRTPLTSNSLCHFDPSVTLSSKSAMGSQKYTKDKDLSWSESGDVEARAMKMRGEVKGEK